MLETVLSHLNFNFHSTKQPGVFLLLPGLGGSTSKVYLKRYIFDGAYLYTSVGRVVRKPVKAIPGLKVIGSINFSCIKMCFTPDVLCSLSLVKFKTEGQT